MRFPEIAPQLIANGYSRPVPIKPGTKYPGFPEWQNWTFDPAKAVGWSEYGTGIICGEVIGLDLDSYDAQVTESLRNLAQRVLGPTIIRIGSPPKELLVYRATTHLEKASTAKYQIPGTPKPSQVEVLCHGQQFVAFATHPDTGKPYTWIADESPLNTRFDALPVVDAEKLQLFLSMADEILAAAAGVQRADPFAKNHTTPVHKDGLWSLDIGRAALALLELKPGERDRWRNLAWALADMCGPTSFAVFHEWSRKQPDYTGEDDCMLVWQSNREKTNAITRASLVAEANAAAKALGKKDPRSVAWTAAIAGQRKADHAHAQKSAGDLLTEDLIFVTDQGSYWSVPQRLLVTDRTIRALYLPSMPDNPMGGKENPVAILDEHPGKVIVRSIGYWPGRERVYTERGDRYFNDYKDPGIEPLIPTDEERATWQWFIERSFPAADSDAALFGPWFLNMLAYRIQCPGEKIYKATLMHSPTAGNGKSTWSLFIPRILLGTSNVSEPRHAMVEGAFNDFFAKAQLVHFDEIRFGGGRIDAAKVMDNSKTPIDSSELTINAKFEKPYRIRNCAWVTATSNRGDALAIDDSERRWGVYELMAPALTMQERKRLFTDWLNTERGPGTLKFLLLERDLTDFDPMMDPPETEAKRAMKRTSEPLQIQLIREGLVGQFQKDIVPVSAIADYVNEKAKFPTAPNTLGVLIKNSTLEFKACYVETAARRMRAYIVRNHDQWIAATERERGHYLDTGEIPNGQENSG